MKVHQNIEKMTITNILLIIFFLIILITFSCSFFYLKKIKRSSKIFFKSSSTTLLNKQEFNPDISTNNWDLHKLRLGKFKRSQYKGLTFFVSCENRIYYLSEEGDKVYC